MPTITQDILKARDALLQGDLVAIPTETVYGLAADATQPNAVRKVFDLKNRPTNHPLILHVLKDWDLNQWCQDIPDYAYKLIENYWPGPLTLVLNKKTHSLDPIVSGGHTTLAIRAPKHPITQGLLKALGRPLVAPSANPFKKVSPTTSAHVFESFEKSELLILEGGRCQIGLESTILQATHERSYSILRHGLLDEKAIKSYLQGVEELETSKVSAPGRMAQHYQPMIPLYYFENAHDIQAFLSSTSQKAYVLSFEKISSCFASFQFSQDPNEVAYELYYQFRLADKSEAKLIAVQRPPKTTPWAAIDERIIKAGTPPPSP